MAEPENSAVPRPCAALKRGRGRANTASQCLPRGAPPCTTIGILYLWAAPAHHFGGRDLIKKNRPMQIRGHALHSEAYVPLSSLRQTFFVGGGGGQGFF